MVRFVVVGLLGCLGACGRLSFDSIGTSGGDAGSDANGTPRDALACTANHDEDGDGIDDNCDPCPQIAGDAADSDGDGVGNACDPEPNNPRQSIALFDPFVALSDDWVATTNVPAPTVHDGVLDTGDVDPLTEKKGAR